ARGADGRAPAAGGPPRGGRRGRGPHLGWGRAAPPHPPAAGGVRDGEPHAPAPHLDRQPPLRPAGLRQPVDRHRPGLLVVPVPRRPPIVAEASPSGTGRSGLSVPSGPRNVRDKCPLDRRPREGSPLASQDAHDHSPVVSYGRPADAATKGATNRPRTRTGTRRARSAVGAGEPRKYNAHPPRNEGESCVSRRAARSARRSSRP